MNKAAARDERDAIEDLRAEFPGAAQGTYLSTCTRGLLPLPARRALDAHLSEMESGGVDKAALFRAVERARAGFARLVRCDADEVALTKNVSEGLNIVAASLDWRPGDNVVVCLPMEHPNNVYPWLNLRDGRSIEIRQVTDRDGHVDAGRLLDAMDARTRLVTLPTVTFSPGFRTDVAAVGRVCREKDVFLLADGVQSVGILDTDVDALGIDGLAVSTQKGLCGLYGMGFLYCRRAWAERMRPPYLARFGVDLGQAHEAALGSGEYRLMRGARRFDLGNYNYPGAIAVEQSLDILNRIGTAVVEPHVRHLATRLAEGFLEIGLPVAGGPPGAHIGSIVSVGRMDQTSHDSTADSGIARLSSRLAAAGVVHSIRRGMLRFAFHLYNAEADVARVLEIARSDARGRQG